MDVISAPGLPIFNLPPPGIQDLLSLTSRTMARSPPSVVIPHISAEDFANCKFDYLVVGGGTAGLVVAARLSEDPSITVGVLEAGSGGVGDPAIDVPGLYGSTLGTEYDWQFETVPQPGLAGRRLPWPRGKVLGGTSALNFMTWNRPSRDDFDAWERLGNVGWGWDGLLSVIIFIFSFSFLSVRFLVSVWSGSWPAVRRYCVFAPCEAPTFRIHDLQYKADGGTIRPFFMSCSFPLIWSNQLRWLGFTMHRMQASPVTLLLQNYSVWTATELFFTTAHFTRKQRAFTNPRMTGASRRISFCTKLTPLARLAPCTSATPRSTLHPTVFGTPH